MKTLSFITLSLLIILLVSCNYSEKRSQKQVSEREEVIKTIHSAIGWAATKDTSLLYSSIARDSNFLEVHPTTRVVYGFEEFRKAEAFWLNLNFKAVGYEIRDLKLNISESGTVAWFYCELDDMNEWKGQPANWMNTRWTGVLERRDGKWRVVQQHFSFAQED